MVSCMLASIVTPWSDISLVSASLLQNTASVRMFGTPGIAGSALPMHAMLTSSNHQGGGSPVVVKHELLNPAAGLVNR